MVNRQRSRSDGRRIVLVTAILVTVVMAVLFVNVQTSLAASSGKTRTITDMNGKKVEVPDPLTRVALFGGPTGQIAYVLGARDQLCAVTSSLKGSDRNGKP
jgi:ABC-type Fe3+-hydroxamate transport system substrate-binding protein